MLSAIQRKAVIYLRQAAGAPTGSKKLLEWFELDYEER